jgi:hypothetical protein
MRAFQSEAAEVNTLTVEVDELCIRKTFLNTSQLMLAVNQFFASEGD